MTREGASEDAKAAQIIRHRCPEGLILALMKRTIDDLPVVRASTLVAHGDIRRDAKTALIRFGDDGVEYQVGVRMHALSGRRLLGAVRMPAVRRAAPSGCVCSMVSRLASSALGRAGLIYRSQSIRTEKRHVVTAPPRIALLSRDTPMRINSRPNRVAERRANIEFALAAFAHRRSQTWR